MKESPKTRHNDYALHVVFIPNERSGDSNLWPQSQNSGCTCGGVFAGKGDLWGTEKPCTSSEWITQMCVCVKATELYPSD